MSASKAESLPPPARTILSYAVLAWAREHQIPCQYCWPPLPHRMDWIPTFRKAMNYLHWKDWLLCHAVAGMALTDTPEEIARTLPAAFNAEGFKTQLENALAFYAARPESACRFYPAKGPTP